MRTESNVTLLKLLKQSKLSLLRWLSFHHLLFLFHCYIRVTFYFLLQYHDSTCLNKKIAVNKPNSIWYNQKTCSNWSITKFSKAPGPAGKFSVQSSLACESLKQNAQDIFCKMAGTCKVNRIFHLTLIEFGINSYEIWYRNRLMWNILIQ